MGILNNNSINENEDDCKEEYISISELNVHLFILLINYYQN